MKTVMEKKNQLWFETTNLKNDFEEQKKLIEQQNKYKIAECEQKTNWQLKEFQNFLKKIMEENENYLTTQIENQHQIK